MPPSPPSVANFSRHHGCFIVMVCFIDRPRHPARPATRPSELSRRRIGTREHKMQRICPRNEGYMLDVDGGSPGRTVTVNGLVCPAWRGHCRERTSQSFCQGFHQRKKKEQQGGGEATFAVGLLPGGSRPVMKTGRGARGEGG